MDNFTYWNPTKLIFGKDQLEQLKTEVPPIRKEYSTCLWRWQY
jgi:alcohol dehydrogenase YqhD (iron-dependent ADH family)